MLASVVKVLNANRDAYDEIALANSGTVKSDSAIDIDGGIFTLATYAKLGAGLGGQRGPARRQRGPPGERPAVSIAACDGGRAPAFKGNTFFTVDMAFKTITEGRRTTDVMPPWGKAFTPEQIWELVSYLNHLSKQPADD